MRTYNIIEFMEKSGPIFKEMRMESKIKQADVARKLDLAVTNFSNWENNVKHRYINFINSAFEAIGYEITVTIKRKDNTDANK